MSVVSTGPFAKSAFVCGGDSTEPVDLAGMDASTAASRGTISWLVAATIAFNLTRASKSPLAGSSPGPRLRPCEPGS